REPRRPQGGRDRAPAPLARAVAPLPQDGEGGLGLRAAPRRAGVQGARWLTPARSRAPITPCVARASAAACSSRSPRRSSGQAIVIARAAASTPARSAGRKGACREKASG